MLGVWENGETLRNVENLVKRLYNPGLEQNAVDDPKDKAVTYGVFGVVAASVHPFLLSGIYGAEDVWKGKRLKLLCSR